MNSYTNKNMVLYVSFLGYINKISVYYIEYK